jgi:hypothetical protein
MKKHLETLRKKIPLVRDIQGLFDHSEALLSFWDLKLKITNRGNKT